MDAQQAAGEIDERGWTILPSVIAQHSVEALKAEVETQMTAASSPFGSNDFLGTRTRRLFNLLARGDAFADVPLLPAVLDVVDTVLDTDCLLSSLTAVEMHPGETNQPFHADDGSIPLPRPHPAYTCTAIWALTDFTLENGATRLVPGSHARDTIPRKGDRPAFVQAEMQAGSVLLYHGSLWHGGAANRSDGRRLGIIANYCAGFLRQEECQLLALPAERVRSFPHRLQRLVGYSTYRGLLGHVDQQDPQIRLDPTQQTRMVWDRIRS